MTRARAISVLLLGLAVLALQACNALRGDPSGSLETVSRTGNGLRLPGEYQTAIYAHDGEQGASFFLSDASLDDLIAGTVTQGQIVHIELLWVPKPGSTPLDASATNVSIRHVVIADGEVGIYGGGGFATPRGSIGAERLGMALRDASLELIESTDGFRDLLKQAQMRGQFTARRDDTKARQMQFAVSQMVTDALGRSRTVRLATDAIPTT